VGEESADDSVLLDFEVVRPRHPCVLRQQQGIDVDILVHGNERLLKILDRRRVERVLHHTHVAGDVVLKVTNLLSITTRHINNFTPFFFFFFFYVSVKALIIGEPQIVVLGERFDATHHHLFQV
jgi:hypothetical protein